MLRRTRKAMPLLLLLASACAGPVADIPLPEHPRPDLYRAEWQNLNGSWSFRPDPEDAGTRDDWQLKANSFDLKINVPFPWGSPLSGVPDSSDIAWYARHLDVPASWSERRVFLVVGAADWKTTAWLDGDSLGTHAGGYTPFEFEITGRVGPGHGAWLVLRVDDSDHAFKLEGKQGYGNARGVWQTVYLEARGDHPVRSIHVAPGADLQGATATITLLEPAERTLPYTVSFPHDEYPDVSGRIEAGAKEADVNLLMAGARPWSLQDPYLHDLVVTIEDERPDEVATYFGMRTISVEPLPGSEAPYVALNGRPVYLQLALDQAFHPGGFYAFASDSELRRDVQRARDIGLNGLRVHVKVGLPRKLYWADRIGMLIMADVPNSWGEPDSLMRREAEHALSGMMERDFNHPSVFSWVLFNETWGLRRRVPGDGEMRSVYDQETRDWVVDLVRRTRAADPTRLVEDNSVCCGVGHTVTDLNSWHDYRPGWAWSARLDEASRGSYAGSSWNYEPGYVNQGHEPNINSEFGNVWGYEGSTGDVDWSWDYHRALNAFRRHPVVAGWLYTEHHDVINEWNGYWRFDRTEKETGLGELVPGMTLRDLHSPLYISIGHPADLSLAVDSASTAIVDLWASWYGDRALEDALIAWSLVFRDHLGREVEGDTGSVPLSLPAWHQGALDSLQTRMPPGPAVAVLRLVVRNKEGEVIHRNFQTFAVGGTPPDAEGKERYVRRAASDYALSEWSDGSWDVLDGLKVNGAGHGALVYRFAWPEGLEAVEVEAVRFLVEASAKQFFDKDRADAGAMDDDYMRGGGTLSPHRNPNAYPMTDEVMTPSVVAVTVNGIPAGRADLADDPADHRGILSWHAQLQDRRLREAGSYGYLVDIAVPADAIADAARSGEIEVRLSVDESSSGGLAVYGSRFGRYPLDPTVVFTLRD